MAIFFYNCSVTCLVTAQLESWADVTCVVTARLESRASLNKPQLPPILDMARNKQGVLEVWPHKTPVLEPQHNEVVSHSPLVRFVELQWEFHTNKQSLRAENGQNSLFPVQIGRYRSQDAQTADDSRCDGSGPQWSTVQCSTVQYSAVTERYSTLRNKVGAWWQWSGKTSNSFPSPGPYSGYRQKCETHSYAVSHSDYLVRQAT